MYPQSLRGTFASSTKYLMQSSWPYFAADITQSTLPHQISFFLRRDISRCLSDHRMTACIAASFSVSREGFTLSKRNRTQSRCPAIAACLHDSSSSHGQPLEKQYFSISRLPLSAAAVNRLFIPLALFHFSRPLEKLEFVR